MRGNLSPEQLAKLKEAFDNSSPSIPTGDPEVYAGPAVYDDPAPFIGNKLPTSDPGPTYDDDWSTRGRPLPRDGRELPGFNGNRRDGKGYIPDFPGDGLPRDGRELPGVKPSDGHGLQGFGRQAQDPRIAALLNLLAQSGGTRGNVGRPDDTLSQAGRFEMGR